MSESKYVVVYVTAPAQKAGELAKALVERQLVACVNILSGARSIYRWQGEVCDEPESLLVIKTRRKLFEPLRSAVVELHPYEVPEVIALPVVAGHQDYLQWIDESTQPEGDSSR